MWLLYNSAMSQKATDGLYKCTGCIQLSLVTGLLEKEADMMTILAGVLYSKVVGLCSTVDVGVARRFEGCPCWL